MDPKAEDPLPDVATTFDPMPQASNRMGRNMYIYIYMIPDIYILKYV